MTSSSDQPTPVGTPDRPAMKPRKGVLLVLLSVYVVWVGLMITWSVQLQRN